MQRRAEVLVGSTREVCADGLAASSCGPTHRQLVALPDSRTRWEAIWHHRAEPDEIAHSHPVGPKSALGRERDDDRSLDAASTHAAATRSSQRAS